MLPLLPAFYVLIPPSLCTHVAAWCFFIMCLTLECKCYVGQGHCFVFHCSYVLVEQSSHLVRWHTVLQSSLLVYKAECCSTTHSLLLIFHWLLSNTILFWFRSCAYYSYFYFIIYMTKIFLLWIQRPRKWDRFILRYHLKSSTSEHFLLMHLWLTDFFRAVSEGFDKI